MVTNTAFARHSCELVCVSLFRSPRLVSRLRRSVRSSPWQIVKVTRCSCRCLPPTRVHGVPFADLSKSDPVVLDSWPTLGQFYKSAQHAYT